ncbi:uncharacterized protein F5Z01DRAFT_355154 [Emericellopsis atlantica]|uniref:Uncharacterized protein n=1 Tax=Emericellopsis atlantica TaxID=2614577 RepID=A0A9P7ZF41_9HYPO|nr:uncharacterized protein F5Z01DRAFT_355154 [Emericellopsis atlantica]KAG9250657.1 hypothetical protein F5Z01DRAFT_355154 [Emericellopsis atlantica]
MSPGAPSPILHLNSSIASVPKTGKRSVSSAPAQRNALMISKPSSASCSTRSTRANRLSRSSSAGTACLRASCVKSLASPARITGVGISLPSPTRWPVTFSAQLPPSPPGSFPGYTPESYGPFIGFDISSGWTRCADGDAPEFPASGSYDVSSPCYPNSKCGTGPTYLPRGAPNPMVLSPAGCENDDGISSPPYQHLFPRKHGRTWLISI